MPARPSTLTVVCVAGLGNRLLSLASGAAIARASGRAFRMIWPPTDACSAPFDNLFSSERLVRSGPSDPGTWLVLADRWRAGGPDLITEYPGDATILAGGMLLLPHLYPHHAQWQQFAFDVVASLAPAAHLQLRIDAFARAHFRTDVIGVHLRRGDFVRRQPDLVANTDLAIAAVDERLAATPDATIFLCTDDGGPDQVTGRIRREGVRQRFKTRYGSRVVWTSPRTLDRRDPRAVEDAVVDLWLLRRTSAFVGTAASTFSEMAIFGRTVDALLCGAPTQRYVWTARLARATGLDALLRAIPLRSRPGPDASFAAVWAYYASLPRAGVRRIRGAFTPSQN
jgi:hypothetical protein